MGAFQVVSFNSLVLGDFLLVIFHFLPSIYSGSVPSNVEKNPTNFISLVCWMHVFDLFVQNISCYGWVIKSPAGHLSLCDGACTDEPTVEDPGWIMLLTQTYCMQAYITTKQMICWCCEWAENSYLWDFDWVAFWVAFHSSTSLKEWRSP